MELNPEILQAGAIGIVFIFAIKEFFAWQKSKKSNSSNGKILQELQLMNNNHLNTICRTIGEGNKEIVKTLNDLGEKLGSRLDNIADNTSRIIGRGDK